MPSATTDQGLSLPIGADAANNPTAFGNFVAGVEVRLVRIYTNEADRTARMLVVAENELSGLGAEDRVEVYNGAAHVSLYTRSLYAMLRKTADQNVGPSNTTLQNITGLVAAVPGTAGAVFPFRATIFYDASTAADIKFAFTIPAGATIKWGTIGIATGAATSSFDGTFGVTTGGGSSIALGGIGVGSPLNAVLHGEVVMGATAGNLQLQAAQQASDATATTVQTGSRLEVWRSS